MAIAMKKNIPQKKKSQKTVKKKQVGKPKKYLRRQGLGSALVALMKKKGGRDDIAYEDAPDTHLAVMDEVPITERAGYPLVRAKGSVDPAKWRTNGGKEVIVDFRRFHWLPDDWGQGVKSTNQCWRSAKGGDGGTYTVVVSPDGHVFYHKSAAEEYAGKEFTKEGGFNGQVRLAQLQAKEAVQLARMQIKDLTTSKTPIGTDSDNSLFAILNPKERKCLVKKDAFHFAVVSARRASKVEGVRDIFMVQSQFMDAGVTPTWYVDAESLDDYKKLGLKAVVGGKLTPSRNKALQDAARLGKVCVQVSDDISAWEYRHGKRAAVREDDAMNAAHAAAKRYIVSPVAAAQFILAKMRGSPLEQKPKLGGVYMLGSCARTFAGDEFGTKHFILGDFFVADTGSKVRFDESMTLKEDYDFTCSHIRAHGSVMRCNRMTLQVKHYSNSGGACTNRDKKGEQERKNIAILTSKWPRAFRPNHKRKNEVIMSWPADDDAEGVKTPLKKSGRASSKAVKKTNTSKAPKAVKKAVVKKKVTQQAWSPKSVLVSTGKETTQPYIAARCKKVHGKTVEQVLGSVQFKTPSGHTKTYGVADLKYDLFRGYLTLKGGKK
eukprot:gb/GFBE01006144.1/.p1 GENE.gb/GFBE01006144.1/~~gb/GFBE01006144.1/.p1  ORF type:complete len:604 (+),score=156.38 gb/GFBE01006144.1/:1-1812(+)